jgi:hypothetical protein
VTIVPVVVPVAFITVRSAVAIAVPTGVVDRVSTIRDAVSIDIPMGRLTVA